MSFAQLRGRLSVAKLLLQQQQPALLKSQSKLQTNAVLALLQNCVLTAEERGVLAAFTGAAGFTEEDSLAILKALEQEPPKPKEKSKVVYHDFKEFIHYLTADEWAVAQQTVDSAVRVFVQVLVQRLRCLHADEHTLKRLAATAIAHTSVDNLASAPTIAGNVHKTVKDQYRKAQRKFKCKGNKPIEPMPDTPLVLVPPVLLQRMFPAYAASIKVVDDWCPPPQSVAASRVFLVDSLMSCRGGSTNNLVTNMALTSPSAGLMNSGGVEMLQYLFQQFAERMGGNRRDRDEGPCEIRLGSGSSRQKRSLKDFIEGGGEIDGHPQAWRRSSTLPALDQGPQCQHQAANAADLDTRAAPPLMSPEESGGNSAAAVVPQPAAAGAPAAPAKPASEVVIPETKGGAEAAEPLTRGQRLMKAYVDRENSKKMGAPKAPKPKAAPKAPKPKASPKGKDDVSLPTKTNKKHRKNRVEHESSRNQYLARGPDGSKQFRYGKGETYVDAAKAKIAAQKWIKGQS